MRAGSCCMPRRTCRTPLLGWSATTAPTRRPSPGRTGQSWRRMARHGARGRASSAPPTPPSRPTRRSRTSPPPRRRSSIGPSMPPRIPGNRRDAARDDLLLDRSSSALRPPTLHGVGGVPSSASARSGCGVLFGPSPRAITCRVCRRVLASPPGIDQHTTGPLSVREAFPSRCSSRANAPSGRAVYTVSGMGEVGVPCLSGYVPRCSGRIQRGGRSENLDSE